MVILDHHVAEVVASARSGLHIARRIESGSSRSDPIENSRAGVARETVSGSAPVLRCSRVRSSPAAGARCHLLSRLCQGWRRAVRRRGELPFGASLTLAN